MEHVYYQGWDCVCEAERLPSGGFQAIACCRSLLSGQPSGRVVDSQVYETASQALIGARAVAMKWTDENRDHPLVAKLNAAPHTKDDHG